MKLDFQFGQKDDAITIPYPAFFNEKRNNNGFFNLRTKPELIDEIKECNSSLALKKMLIRFAVSQLPIFTVGCDLGNHIEASCKENESNIAGGYIQFTSLPDENIDHTNWWALFKNVENTFLDLIGNDNWILNIILSPLCFKLAKSDEIVDTVNVNFWAKASSLENAIDSRERLILELDKSLSADTIYKFFH